MSKQQHISLLCRNLIFPNFTVTLPDVEGILLNKKAGTYRIEEGKDFEFTFTLKEEYNQSEPIVTTSRGDVLEMNAYGYYWVDNVDNDIEISISNIFRNEEPTANTDVHGEDMQTWVRKGILYIRLGSPQQIRLTDMGGRPHRTLELPAGESQIEGLSTGFYILSVPNRTGIKIVIH